MQSRTSRNSGVLAKRTLCEQGIRTSRSGNFEDLNSDVRFLVQVRVDGQFVLSKQQIRPDPYSGRRRRPVQPKCSRDVDLARARELKLLYRGQYVHEMLLAIHARWEASNCADGSVLGSSSIPGVSPTRRVQVALFGSESHHSRYSCSDAHQDLDRRHRCQRASSTDQHILFTGTGVGPGPSFAVAPIFRRGNCEAKDSVWEDGHRTVE